MQTACCLYNIMLTILQSMMAFIHKYIQLSFNFKQQGLSYLLVFPWHQKARNAHLAFALGIS